MAFDHPGKLRGFLKEVMPKLKPEGMGEQSKQRKQYMQRPCGRRKHVKGAARRYLWLDFKEQRGQLEGEVGRN